jgi:hypothetical protein
MSHPSAKAFAIVTPNGSATVLEVVVSYLLIRVNSSVSGSNGWRTVNVSVQYTSNRKSIIDSIEQAIFNDVGGDFPDIEIEFIGGWS